MPQPSLKDVAVLAGVSFQTASKALNGTGRMTPSTRRRVQLTAQSLGYIPNALAQDLQRQATRTVGVMSADFSDTTLAQIVVGLEREARRRGYSVLIGSLDETGSDWEHYLRVLIEQRVDGIILDAPTLEHASGLRLALPPSPPIVSLNRLGDAENVSCVFGDAFGGATMAVRHLTSLGHARIGMITGRASREVTRLRARAYRQVLDEAGLRFDEALIEGSNWDPKGGYDSALRLIERRPELTALYVQNDMMAVGALAALHERGRRVPRDCAVVGTDDLPIASRTIPPLTTVRVPFQELGEMAMRILVEHLEDSGRPPDEVTLPMQMVYRQSSGMQLARWKPPSSELRPAPTLCGSGVESPPRPQFVEGIVGAVKS